MPTQPTLRRAHSSRFGRPQRFAHRVNWPTVGQCFDIEISRDADGWMIRIPELGGAARASRRAAVELAARYGRLSVDKSAFPIFADPLTSASAARSWTLGVNWYANRNVKIVLNYEQTDFQTAEGGVKRKQERALLERFQLAF